MVRGGRGPARRRSAAYDGATRLLSLAMIVLGVLLVARGALLAIVVGVAMIGAGAGRMWVVAQQRRR